MSFSVKKSYMDKIRKDQKKFTVPDLDSPNEEDVVVLKNVINGSADAAKNAPMADKPPVLKNQSGGARMHKTVYTYADR